MTTTSIELRTLAPQPTLAIRTQVPLARIGAAIGELLPMVYGYARTTGAEVIGPPFVRYFTVGDLIDLEAGVTLASAAPGQGRITPGELPGGEAAVAWHLGPYETIGATYAEVQRFAAREGRSLGPSMWEVYWTDPASEPDPAAWRTEVFCPLAPASARPAAASPA
jgi:effector-binding domain-containing protein